MAEELSQDDSSDDEDVDQSSESDRGQTEPDEDKVDGNIPTIEAKSGSASQVQATWTVLYIQMEYCKPEVGFLLLAKSDRRRTGRKPP